MSKKLVVFALVLCAAVATQTGVVQAEEATTTTTTTTSISSNLDLLQSLMAQIEVLQKKLAELRGQAIAVQHELRAGLREGTTGEDVKKIQELLATDPTLYPEGLSTGFFGPLTREALKRFQHRHELAVTGAMDEDTRELLEEYLDEKGNGQIPPGFLRAPGIIKKIEMRFAEDCENRGEGKGAFCNKLKLKWKMEHGDDKDKDEGDDKDNDADELEIEADIRTNDTRVVIEFPNDTKRVIEVNSTDEEEVIDAIVEKTELTEDEVRAAIVFDDKDNGDDVDEDKNEDKNADDAAADAKEAIAEADEVIDALVAAIDEATAGSAKTAAADALADAEDLLAEADSALEDGDAEAAKELAEEAEHAAKEAFEDLTGEEFESSNDGAGNT